MTRKTKREIAEELDALEYGGEAREPTLAELRDQERDLWDYWRYELTKARRQAEYGGDFRAFVQEHYEEFDDSDSDAVTGYEIL